ncbi:MAG: hypothetical protein ACYSUI_20505 [Planctomycetota bacterium]|jgi:hypothetical protein
MSWRRPSRLRRVLKWAGLGVCVVIVAAWGVSIRCHLAYAGCKHVVALLQGQVRYAYHPDGVAGHGWYVNTGTWEILKRATVEGNIGKVELLQAWLGLHLPYTSRERSESIYKCPFGLLLVVAAIPTAILWRRDRRPPKGCCQGCGYNLRGNVSGVCPECGESV